MRYYVYKMLRRINCRIKQTRSARGTSAASVRFHARGGQLSGRVERADLLLPFRPRNDFIHRLQELFPLRDPFPSAVFFVAEAELAHVALPIEISIDSIIPRLDLVCYTDLFSGSLMQVNLNIS